jgi:hypothetical protein
LKLKLDNKSINKLKERLDVIEEQTSMGEEETDYEKEIRFAKLREARAKRTNTPGYKTYEQVGRIENEEELPSQHRVHEQQQPEQKPLGYYQPADEPTQEEVDFYKHKIDERPTAKKKFLLYSTETAIYRWMYDEAMKEVEAKKEGRTENV